jgi:hypothetical protein
MLKSTPESPAWAFDESILALRIYHMNEEATRAAASQGIEINVKQIKHPENKRTDLSTAIIDLLVDMIEVATVHESV